MGRSASKAARQAPVRPREIEEPKPLVHLTEDGQALTDQGRAVFELIEYGLTQQGLPKWARSDRTFEQVVRDRFDVSTTRYYQWMNTMLDDGAVEAIVPELWRRLRRIRAARIATRSTRTV